MTPGTHPTAALAALFSLFAATPAPLSAQVTPGTIDGELKISAVSGGFGGGLEERDEFGSSVAAIGDLDGDGRSEIAVGAVGDDDGGGHRGAVWILHPNADGTVGLVTKINSTALAFDGDISNWDDFGSSVAVIGDLDDDGVPDLIVGAPLDDDVCCNDGAAWIVFLTPSGTVKDAAKLSDRTPGFEGVLGPFERFGRCVAGVGDIDGDGVEDVAVGSSHDTSTTINAGAVFLFFLNTDGSVKGWAELSDDTFGAMGLGGLTALGFGYALAALGDVDGNGTPDLAVSSTYSLGAVYVLLMESDGTASGLVTLAEGQGGFVGPVEFNDLFGASIACIGDLDGNGVADLAVGESLDNGGTLHAAGAMWLLFLEPDGTVRSELKLGADSGGFVGPLLSNDWFGWGVTDAGDLGADGTLELVVGAPHTDDGEWDAGAIWVLSLEIGPWFDLGFGLTGTNNKPRLKAEGILVDNALIELQLSRAKAGAPATLVVGFSPLFAPFKGGTLVPAVDLLVNATVGPLGTIDLPALWPPGIPPGIAAWFQWWIVDPVGVQGFAASNGLQAYVP